MFSDLPDGKNAPRKSFPVDGDENIYTFKKFNSVYSESVFD